MHPTTPSITPSSRRKLAGAAVAAAVAALALPAVSPAATTFGSPLTREPEGVSLNSQCPTPGTACTRVGHIYPSADPQMQRAPVDGLITKFRIRSSTPDQVTFRLARLAGENSPAATGVAAETGPTVTLQGTKAVEEYAAHVPVKAGDALALDSIQTTAIYASDGGTREYVFSPTLANGQGPRASSDKSSKELLVQAVIEADADHDGFGDESQDGCVQDARQQGPCDFSGPSFVNFALTKFAFRFQTVAVVKMSEAGKVTFSFKKRVKVRRSYRYVAMRGSFVRTIGAGVTRRIVILPKAGGRKLAPGYYQLVATSSDKLNNKRVIARSFRVIR